MSELDLVFAILIGAILFDLGRRTLLNPRSLFSLEQAFLVGALAFPAASYATRARFRDYYCPQTHPDWLISQILCIAVCWFSFRIWSRAGASSSGRALVTPRSPPPPSSAFAVALLIAAAAVAKLLYANPFSRVELSQSHYVSLMASMLMVGPALIAACQLAFGRQTHLRWIGLLGAGLALALVSGSRTPGFFALVGSGLLLAGRYFQRRSSVHVEVFRRLGAAIVGLLFVLLLLVFASALKLSLGNLRTGQELRLERQTFVAQLVGFSYADVYENSCFLIANYPQTYPFSPGQGLLAVVVGPIPRSAWPAKPRGLSYSLTVNKAGQIYADAGFSLAPGLTGELWTSGGWIAIVIGSLLLASSCVGLAQLNRFLANRWQFSELPGYTAVWCMTVLYSRGDFYTITQKGGSFLVGTILASLFATRFHSWLAPHRASPKRPSIAKPAAGPDLG